MEKFNDPIDELIARHMNESEIAERAQSNQNIEVTKEDFDHDNYVDIEPIEDVADVDEVEDDIDYGDNDLNDEIAAEEQAEIEAKQAAYDEAAKAKEEEEKHKSAPVINPYDEKYHSEMIGFQTEKLAIVSMMVNKVIAKHHIISGGIPEDIKMHVMGDLINVYHRTGEEITPEFEEIILKNWVGGTTGEESNMNERDIPKKDGNKKDELDNDKSDRNTTININVEPGTPVTVNVDGEMMSEIDRKNEINIVVHEVSEQEMRSSTIIENSQLDGIITPYESEATDVPLTLPMSAYRCTMGGVSMFDIIKLSSLQNGNSRDVDIKTWSLIYKHLKNPSIGNFKSFEDFLKHTDYRDMELLLWGAFVATADEVETIHFTCGNPKCKEHIEFKYNPRTLVHVNDKLVPEHYNKTHQVASGKAAVDHWNEIHSKHKIYELPESKVLIELDDFSAWDYHNIKMPIMQTIYNRFRPDDATMDIESLSEEEAQEFNFLLLFLLYIKSVTINKNGKSYRYTDWKDIEKVVTSHLGNRDLNILIGIINQVRNTESPISFYMENVECPKCGHKDDRIPVDNIMRSLFFQLSNGLNNTTINFVETGKI